MLIVLLSHGALTKAPVLLVVLGVMSLLGFLFWKTKLRDLMDEVYDCGDYLLVKKRDEEDTILLSNILDVKFSANRDGTAPRITLLLEAPGKFGKEVSFAPPVQFRFITNPGSRNEIAADLLARVERARSRAV
jgi:hypothetical protein